MLHKLFFFLNEAIERNQWIKIKKKKIRYNEKLRVEKKTVKKLESKKKKKKKIEKSILSVSIKRIDAIDRFVMEIIGK